MVQCQLYHPPSLTMSLPHITTHLLASLVEGSPKKTIVREEAVSLKILPILQK